MVRGRAMVEQWWSHQSTYHYRGVCPRVEAEAGGIEGEQERQQYWFLACSSAACHHIWQAALQPDIMWPVCEVLFNPYHQVLVHLHHQELLSQVGWLFGSWCISGGRGGLFCYIRVN